MVAAKPISLPQIEIASPCSAEWSAMEGDERVRFCRACQKNVFNLSSLTEAEAVELLAAHDGRLCLRIFRRADGTVLTADCPVGWAAVRRRMIRGIAAAVLLAATMLAGTLTALGMSRSANRVRQAGALQQLRQALQPPEGFLGDVCVPTPGSGS